MKKTVIALLVMLIQVAVADACLGEANLFLQHRIELDSGKVTAVTFSPDSRMVAFGTEDGGITLLNVRKGEKTPLSTPHAGGITSLAFSNSGKYLASASSDKTVYLLDPEGNRSPVLLKNFKGRADRVVFSGDGRYAAADGDDHDIFIWEVPSGHLRSRMEGHEDDVLAIGFNQPEGTLISVDSDDGLFIWDLSSAKLLRRYRLEAVTLPNSGTEVSCAEISSDRLFVAAGMEEHVLKKGVRGMIFKYHIAFFDIAKGILIKILEDNRRRIEDLALYPGNCLVAFDNSTLQDKKLTLRNIESGEFDLRYNLDDNCPVLAFSPDGAWLAGGVESARESGKPLLYIWEVDYEMPASGCFMGRIRLTSSPQPVLQPGVPGMAAVIPFGVSGTGPELGVSAAHFLESRLAGNPYLKLLERSRVADIINELKLQQSELVDKDKAVRVGKMLGASLIITGNVDRVGADLVVSARIIDVQSGEILGLRELHCGQCGADDLFDAIDILAPALVQE